MMKIRLFQKDCRGIDLLSLLCCLFLFPVFSHAAVDSLVALDAVDVNSADVGRIVQGGENFKKTCLSCHSLNDFMNDDIAKTLGLTKEQMPSWPEDSWNGHPPPDLSLVTAYRGIDHVYSYLSAYYQSESTESGYDNLVLPGTQMPNPFAIMQGDQHLVSEAVDDMRLFQSLELVRRGSMTPQEFNDYVVSIVAYLEYASDPSIYERYHYGPYVVGFLIIFVLIMIFLDLVYWREIHRHHR